MNDGQKIEDDARLVRRCLDGDEYAFGLLVDKYSGIIYNLAFRLTSSQQDAEDVTQNTFVKVYENLSSYNRKYKFFSWIYRISINEALNIKSRRKAEDEIDENLVASEKNPEVVLGNSDLAEKIQKALMALEPNYRIVIVLKHFAGFSYREIGYILDLKEKTVKSRLYTARQLLKDILMSRGIVQHD